MDPNKRRVKRFNLVFIIVIVITLAIIGLGLLSLGDHVQSRNNVPNQTARVFRVVGMVLYSENGISRQLQRNDMIQLRANGTISIPRGANFVAHYSDGTSERFDGPLEIRTYVLDERLIARYLSEINRAIEGGIRMIVLVLVVSLFFLFWLVLCFKRNHSMQPAFILSAICLALFFMIYTLLGKLPQAQLTPFFVLLALLVYPVAFLASLLFFIKNEEIPEFEEMDDLTADLLYDGLLLFEKGNFDEALKKFLKAGEIAPDRTDVKNLVKITQLKINDPDKLDKMVNVELRMRSFFKKGFMERIRKKRGSFSSSIGD